MRKNYAELCVIMQLVVLDLKLGPARRSSRRRRARPWSLSHVVSGRPTIQPAIGLAHPGRRGPQSRGGPATTERLGRSGPRALGALTRTLSRSARIAQMITDPAPRHSAVCARADLRPLGRITLGPHGGPLISALGVTPQLWTFSQPSTCCVYRP